MRVIDVHNHVNPRPFLAAVRAKQSWHDFNSRDGELENPRNSWELEERIAEMDRLGVDVQALTVYGDFNKYDRELGATVATVGACNDEVAAMVGDYPDRFVGLGILPMQDVAAAVEELERIVGIGLLGVTVKDHVNGHTLDEPHFLPFWEAAERLGVVVEFHQGDTIVEKRIPRYFLENTVGNLVERTLTFGALVQGGVMDKFPDLKVCLLHGGGYVAFAVARMDKGWEAEKLPYMGGYSAGEDPRQTITHPPSSYVGHFYYDCATFSEPTLRFLIDTVGIDRVVFGTDYPCPMEIINSVKWINSLKSLTMSEKEAILSSNPSQMLSI
jgi:aminocarboxymuconate-semialdehyde decarboxylase